MMEHNKKFWEEFIEQYHQLPCLWDVKSNEYLNKNKKNVGYNILLEKLREINPQANLDILKKKISNMRTAFRRELKKVQDSKSTSDIDIYEPTLWYFELLLFTAHSETGKVAKFIDEQEEDFENKVVDNMDAIMYVDEASQTSHTSSSPRNANNYSRKRVKSEVNPIEEKKVQLLDLAHNDLTINEDEYGIAGKRIGLQLKGLEEKQRFIAEKLISDVMYYGRMRKLTENSSVQYN